MGSQGGVASACSFFFQAEDGIRDYKVTGVQTCALPICRPGRTAPHGRSPLPWQPASPPPAPLPPQPSPWTQASPGRLQGRPGAGGGGGGAWGWEKWCDSPYAEQALPILQVRLDFFCALAWIRALFLPSSLDKAKTGCYVFIFLCPGFRGPRPGDAGTWLEKCPGAWKNCGAGCPRWQSRTAPRSAWARHGRPPAVHGLRTRAWFPPRRLASRRLPPGTAARNAAR